MASRDPYGQEERTDTEIALDCARVLQLQSLAPEGLAPEHPLVGYSKAVAAGLGNSQARAFLETQIDELTRR